MIKALLKSGARRFGRRYRYDTSYMTDVIDISTAAGIRLSLWPLLLQHRGPARARDVVAGAALASTLEGDCGPCAQLVIDMALEAGVEASAIALCLKGQTETAGDLGLGMRFAYAAIKGAPELEALRADIKARHGAEAVVAASFAAATGRMYPVLKRGLGFGQFCQTLEVSGQPLKPEPSR